MTATSEEGRSSRCSSSGSACATSPFRSTMRLRNSRRCGSSPFTTLRLGPMRVVKPGPDREVPRGVVGGAEISQATAGAHNIYMGVFRVPPGAQSRPHYHERCESAVYMLSGGLRVRWGDHLEQEVLLEPRDLVYVPPRETHVLENV